MAEETGSPPGLRYELGVISALSYDFMADIAEQAVPPWYEARGWRILDVGWHETPPDRLRGGDMLSHPWWGEVRVQSPCGSAWEIVFTADPPEGGWTPNNYVRGQARPVELREPPATDPELDVPAILRSPPVR